MIKSRFKFCGMVSLLASTFLFASHVNAQVYKCALVDGASGISKIIYTDSPCGKAEKQTRIAIQANSQTHAETIQAMRLAQTNATDTAVTRAVLNRNFKLAESLANTKEHWRLIAIAQAEAPPQPLLVLNRQPEVSRAEECAYAKEDFELVSRNAWRDKDLVAAKKSVMYMACGTPEPIQNRTIFVGQNYTGYGGLYHGHQFLPNHAKPYEVYPNQIKSQEVYGSHGHSNYHRFSGRHQTNNNASFKYQSRHFGVSVNSAY